MNPSRLVPLLTGVVLVALLGACTADSGDVPADRETSGPPGVATGASAGAATPGSTGSSLPVLAERPFSDAINGKDYSLSVQVNEVRVVGRTTRLTFTARNVGPAGSDDWTPAGIWAVDNSAWNVSGVYLIDSVNAKRYLVARAGADKECVCTGGLLSTNVNPGQSLVLSATYQALPAGVSTIDVSIPRAGVFNGIPVAR